MLLDRTQRGLADDRSTQQAAHQERHDKKIQTECASVSAAMTKTHLSGHGISTNSMKGELGFPVEKRTGSRPREPLSARDMLHTEAANSTTG
jgi:hypothetical protein